MLEGVAIRGTVLPGVLADQLPVVVAQDLGPILRHQELGGLLGPQRARDVVAQVEDALHPSPLQVGNHLLEGRQVAVDVGEQGDFLHFCSISCPFLRIKLNQIGLREGCKWCRGRWALPSHINRSAALASTTFR